jgi:hypothetical protein
MGAGAIRQCFLSTRGLATHPTMHDEENTTADSVEPDDEAAEYEELSLDEPLFNEPRERESLGGAQLSLLGMFGLLTVASIYFALERYHHGQFGIHLLAATGLTVVVVLPGLWVVAWLTKIIADGDVLVPLVILALVVTGGVMAGLFSMWR